MRLIAVVLGAPSNQQRFAQAAKLMEWGFDHYTAVSLLRSGEPLPVQVQVENGQYIQPVLARDLKVVLPRQDAPGVKLEYRVPNSVPGPLKAGEQVGLVVVHDHDGVVTEAAALCPVAIDQPAPGTAVAGAADNSWNTPKPAPYLPPNQETQ